MCSWQKMFLSSWSRWLETVLPVTVLQLNMQDGERSVTLESGPTLDSWWQKPSEANFEAVHFILCKD